MKFNTKTNRRNRLALLALAGVIALTGHVSADEVLVYKVSASRKWKQNAELDPEAAQKPVAATPVGRRQVAGVVKDTSYLILNRTTKEVVVVDYFTRTSDGAKVKEYLVHNESYADWTGIFPSVEWEALSVAAPSGRTSFSLKSGGQIIDSDDLNGDGETDAFQEGKLSYFVGAAGPRAFGATTLPNVAASLRGVKREAMDITYGPALDLIGNKFPVARVIYSGAGSQSAVLDSRTTTTALNTPPPAVPAGLTVATTGYALFLVRQLLDKAGFEDAGFGLVD